MANNRNLAVCACLAAFILDKIVLALLGLFAFAPIEDSSLKRKGLLSLLAILACCLTTVAVYAQMPTTVINFGREFAKDVAGYHAAYAAATNRIPSKYMRDLETLRTKFQEAGDLDGLLAVKKEIERYRKVKTEEADPFETVPEMTADVIVAAPAELRKLQEQYVSSFAEAAATLKNSISERGEKYRSQIKAMQTTLTKAGKIDEAIAVRNEGDRVAKILSSGDISALLGQMDASSTSAPSSASPADTPRRDVGKTTIHSAMKWRLRGSHAFSRDLPRYFAPDVPNELKADYNPAKAIGTLSGRCVVAAAQVGDVLCSWNGRAFIWDVDGAGDLATDIRVKSQTISPGADRGPQLEVAVLANGSKIKSLSVPLMRTDETVKIVRDASNANRFALFWPHGRKSVTFEIPAGAKLNVLIGVVLHNPGETCDLSFQLVPPGAN